jgi:hypothetical protein
LVAWSEPRFWKVLKPAFLKNLRSVDIIARVDFIKCIEGFKKYPHEINRVLKLTAPTLNELSIHRITTPAVKFLEGTGCWPNLKRFSLDGNPDNLVGIREYFHSIHKLHTLSIMEQELNQDDAEV